MSAKKDYRKWSQSGLADEAEWLAGELARTQRALACEEAISANLDDELKALRSESWPHRAYVGLALFALWCALMAVFAVAL